MLGGGQGICLHSIRVSGVPFNIVVVTITCIHMHAYQQFIMLFSIMNCHASNNFHMEVVGWCTLRNIT